MCSFVCAPCRKAKSPCSSTPPPLPSLSRPMCELTSILISAPFLHFHLRIEQDRAEQTTFSFNEVFTEDANQEKVFERVAQPLVTDFLESDRNCFLFAYGNSNAGTFSRSFPPNAYPLVKKL